VLSFLLLSHASPTILIGNTHLNSGDFSFTLHFWREMELETHCFPHASPKPSETKANAKADEAISRHAEAKP
jgi:hypothetical protein